MATKQKRSDKQMTHGRPKPKNRSVVSTNGRHATHGAHPDAVTKFCERDVSLLNELVFKLTQEIRKEVGSPAFGSCVRSLVSEVRLSLDPEDRERPHNGHVPLYSAEDTLVFEALEELARERAHAEAVTMAADFERGERVYAADCEVFSRVALVYGSLKSYNDSPWDEAALTSESG